ncbi:hypothetical protein HQ535_15835, partial [bacterium]|nr:hypothetical protein [bacterium]
MTSRRILTPVLVALLLVAGACSGDVAGTGTGDQEESDQDGGEDAAAR